MNVASGRLKIINKTQGYIENKFYIDPFHKSHNALFSAFDVKFILYNFIQKNTFQKNTFDVERGK
jgi:hypothetical protein